ncbi:MAG: hypothetical protein J2P15_13940 [Micromonosporaceae bacterium]|nr:hypothetical protein [Micromonosporaceae bacterium]
MSSIWIGYIEVPPSVETKIRARRGVTGDQVRGACQWPAKPVRAAWHSHPEHGRRLIVVAVDEQGRILKVILQPVDVQAGNWRLRTVIVSTRGA